MNMTDSTTTVRGPVDDRILEVLARYPEIRVAFLFGSIARCQAGPDSDLDLGVAGSVPLTTDLRLDLTMSLAEAVLRPVDLVDLREAGPAILRSALHGRPVLMADRLLHAFLIVRAVTLAADFEPCRQRILEARRKAWIGI